ncbi:MAG: hydrogenase accessory protein HypB [Verrucomicrobia bacterium]|nr:hydrogenase accessory protein HypB [Verrucomicrobiota bacterium]
MCENCGCSKNVVRHKHGGKWHTHSTHEHEHTHDHNGSHAHDHPATKAVTVEQKILAHNDGHAGKNREWLSRRGIVAINLISSPGSGKTLLLEKTLDSLRGKIKCAVITGDQQTDNDARRLSGKGAIVKQIQTINACHLDAERVGRLLPSVCTKGTKLLFIENVGNLVCPSTFDLGENFKVALVSVTEGEDKPEKYPTLFSIAAVAIVTKIDLLRHLDVKIDKFRHYLRAIHPGICIFELSAKSGKGMKEWLQYLGRLVS